MALEVAFLVFFALWKEDVFDACPAGACLPGFLKKWRVAWGRDRMDSLVWETLAW